MERMKGIYAPILKKEIIGPLLIIISFSFLYFVITRFTKRIFRIKTSKIEERKAKTILSIINNACKYLLILLAVMMILEIYGISTSGFVASLGVVGVVAGLAIQDILKDILSGASIIMENQYAIGDIVEINSFKGEVIWIGLRTTKIKALTGEIKIISNRNISEVINYSMTKSVAIVDIPVSYEEDIDHVQQVLNDLGKSLQKDCEWIVGEMKCVGITDFDSSSINFRMTAEVHHEKRYEVERLIRKEVKKAFDQENITIPYNQVVVHHE